MFFIFTPIPGEMIQFDSKFSDGLKPPNNIYIYIYSTMDLSCTPKSTKEHIHRWPKTKNYKLSSNTISKYSPFSFRQTFDFLTFYQPSMIL